MTSPDVLAVVGVVVSAVVLLAASIGAVVILVDCLHLLADHLNG